MRGAAYLEADWRQETLRTNLWMVPAIEAVSGLMLFTVTIALDRAAYNGRLGLPSWVLSGTANPDHDGGRAHHGRRRRLLDHDRGPDAGLDTVRSPDTAHLHFATAAPR
jgi:hypothetical protein